MNWSLRMASICLITFALVRPAAADVIREVTYAADPVTDHLSASNTFTNPIENDTATQFVFAIFQLPLFDLQYSLVDATLSVEFKTKAVAEVTNLDSTNGIGATHSLNLRVVGLYEDSYYLRVCPTTFSCSLPGVGPGQSVESELEIERELQADVTDLYRLMVSNPWATDYTVIVDSSSWVNSFGGLRHVSIDHDLWAVAAITYRYTVPEPHTLALLGLGLAGLAFTRRRIGLASRG